MFGRKPRLSPLAVRKQLLIAESEVNRVRLNQDWQALAGEVGSFTDRVQSFSKMAVSATSFREDPLRILRGLRLVSELGFEVEPETVAQMKRESAGLQHVSTERIGGGLA